MKKGIFRRKALPLTILATAGLLLCGCRNNGPSSRIVLIVIDTLRADHLPFYGYGRNTAPFLSTLADRGAVFENAYSPSSWTAPASASIFTSLYPFQHGVVTGILAGRDMKMDILRIPEEVPTLPEIMKKAGYRTYGAANNPNIGEEIGFSRGFDHFAQFSNSEDQEMFARLEGWSDELGKQKKYFLYIHFNDCHAPYLRRAPWFEKKNTPRETKISAYDSEISCVDDKIRRLAERCGWDKDTLIIVTADHGEEFREHGGIGHGRTLYAEVINVPMLFVFPDGRFAGKKIGTHVISLDILPTLREYIGGKRGPAEEGMDLMPLLRGREKKAAERCLFSHLLFQNRAGFQKLHRAAIDGEWKHVFVDGGPKKSLRELFHLKNDPGDRNDVLKDHSAAADRLARRCLEFENGAKTFSATARKVDLSEKKREELRTLGYVR